MIRIPKLKSLNSKGIHNNIEVYCTKYNVRIILEYCDDAPIVIIHATDLDNKLKETFYMDEDYFVMNASLLTWMKKKMYNINKGKTRKSKHDLQQQTRILSRNRKTIAKI